MKKAFSLFLVLCVAFGLCIPSLAASAEPSAEPASEEPSGEVDGVLGEHSYTEINGFGLEIAWTLALAADGSYALTEENLVAGRVTYTGSYTVDGNVVTCGPMKEIGPPVYDWADPAGFVVTVTVSGFAPGITVDAVSGEPSGEPSGEAVLSDGGWPLSGSGDTSMDAYKSYLKAYMDCVPEMDGHEEELYGLIDQEIFAVAPVAMAFEDWFQENAMSYEEFVAANGVYELTLFGVTNPPA